MGWKALMKCLWRWKNTNALRWVCSYFCFYKGEFLVVHRKGVCAHPSPEHPAAWSGEASWDVKGTAFGSGNGAWRASSPSISLTRGLYLFSSFLSPTHSFWTRPVLVHSEVERGKQLCHHKVPLWDGNIWLHPALLPKKQREEVRVAAWSLPTGQEGAGGACLGFLHLDAKRALAIAASGKLLNVVKHRRKRKKSYIKVINESKSALCQGSGSRGNLSVW